MKKIIVLALALTLLIALTSCFAHEHSYGEWETKTPATCTEAEVEVRKCSCNAEETRVGDAAVDHNMVNASDDTHHWTACSYDCGTVTEKESHVATSIKAVCNKTDYVQGDVAVAADFTVTATCACGASYEVSEGVVLENATLVSGANIVTVKLGELSSNVQVNADKKVVSLNGTLVEDTYVFSDKKNDVFSDKEAMGTNSGNFRVYLKFNFSNILADTYFAENKDDAKVQFTFTIVEGAYTENTTFTFGGFIPGAGVSDVDFSNITWNSVRTGDFTALDWANAIYPIDQAVGSHHVDYTDTTLTLTFTYGQVKDFIGEDGIAIFTLRAKESGVKISSMEGVAAPAVKVIVDDSHFHAFNQRIESEQYFISANCGEPTYYFKSCRCGEHGDDFFKTEAINEHKFGEWTVVNPATCTEDGAKQRTCTLCENGVEDEVIEHTGHAVDTNWSSDESYHWNNCANCDEKLNSATHAGGTATETEQATCETCGVKYGGLASHVHNHNAVVTAPTCNDAGYTTYTCACGDVYTGDNVDALGHNMETKYDADNHWTDCSRCDEVTAPVAHFGGEATTTEKAVCKGCGQSYGDFKADEPSQVVVNGTILQDTYINNSTSNNQSAKPTMGTKSDNFKVYLQYNLSDFLASASAEDKANAKVQFSFAVAEGSADNNTKVTLKSFTVSDFISGLDFNNDIVTWSNVKSGGDYYALNWADKGKKLIEETPGENVVIEDGMIYVTVDFSAIEKYIDANGNILIALATNTSGLKIASMENTEFAIPAVKVTYTK